MALDFLPALHIFLFGIGGCNSMVECQLPKLEVAGSTPVIRSRIQSLTWLFFFGRMLTYSLFVSDFCFLSIVENAD